jgi:hypothetical protein
VAPIREGNGGVEWEQRGAAAGDCGGGKQWVWAVYMAGEMILRSGAMGVAMVAAGGVDGHRRWRRERGGETEEAV